jgi:hypothetical protein
MSRPACNGPLATGQLEQVSRISFDISFDISLDLSAKSFDIVQHL